MPPTTEEDNVSIPDLQRQILSMKESLQSLRLDINKLYEALQTEQALQWTTRH